MTRKKIDQETRTADEKDVSKEGKRSKRERKRAKEENGEGKYQKPNTEDEARKGDGNIVEI